jgi:hypothetical protein
MVFDRSQTWHCSKTAQNTGHNGSPAWRLTLRNASYDIANSKLLAAHRNYPKIEPLASAVAAGKF